jgi:hypothetical protein
LAQRPIVTDRPVDTDLDLLRTEAYADPANLNDRRAIYAYREPPEDFHAWTLDQVDWPPRAKVLDLGCGPGTHVARSMRPLIAIGTDDRSWERWMADFETLVSRRIAADGALRITDHAGAFVCR